MLVWNNVPVYVAAFFGEALIDIVDKQLSILIAFWLILLIKHEREKNGGTIGKPFAVKCTIGLCLFSVIAVTVTMYDKKRNVPSEDLSEEERYYSSMEDEESILWNFADPSEDIFAGGYVEQIYNNGNGMFSSEANAIAETEDGYIWIGSYAGLTRYDGRTFEYIREGGLASVTVLLTDQKDRLWIGTNDGGIARYDHGEYTYFTKADGLPASAIRCFEELPDGTMYVGTTDRLCRITTEDQVEIIDADVFYVVSMAMQDDSLLGITNAGQLFLMRDDRILATMETGREDAYYRCIDRTDQGIMVGTSAGYIEKAEVSGDSLVIEKTIYTAELCNIASIQSDRQGRTWLNASNGMGYFDEAGRFHSHNYEGFDRSIECMHEDYEGNIWFGSSRYGVMKLSRNRFVDIFSAAGIDPAVVNGVCEFEGAYYCGSDSGLIIIDKNSLRRIENGLAQMLEGSRIRSVYVDSKNHLWLCTYGEHGLVRVDASGSFVSYTAEQQGATSNRFRCIMELEDGTIVAGNNNGINFIHGNQIVDTITGEDGLENEQILCLAPGENGAFYAGTDGAGIYRIEDGKITGHISLAEGLSSEIIMRIVPYNDGYFVVASNSLCFMEQERVRELTQFPYFNNYDLLLYGDDAYVLSSSGIYVTDAEELAAGDEIQYKLYNHTEGLLNALTANSWNYADPDGKIYFCTNQGICYFDDNEEARENQRYKFDIAGVLADDQKIDADYRIYRIAEGVNNISIVPSVRNYTLSDVKLQIFIEGIDKDPKVYTQRTIEPVIVSRIPAGNYRIQLRILSDDEDMVLQEKNYLLVKEAHPWERASFKTYLIIILSYTFITAIWTVLNFINIIRHRRELESMRIETKNEFLANMSNEIRMPVNAILAMDEMILREDVSDKVEEYAYNIQNFGQSLRELVNDVTDFTLMEAGKLSLKKENYRLDEILNDMIHMLSYRAEQKSLEIRLEIEDELPRSLYGDVGRVKQIMVNILTNAINYTEKGYIKLTAKGEITENGKLAGKTDIAAAEKQPEENEWGDADVLMLEISVEDTGIGIRPEDMDKLYGSFTRLDQERNRDVEGNGLALNITKKLIDLMGGEINVQSTYGEGSVFTVRIPQKIVDTHPIGNFNKIYQRRLKRTRRYRETFIAPEVCILSVDDSDMNQEVIKEILKDTKMQISMAMSGSEAIESCRTKKYDLILMDYLMPEMDGIETMQQLRKDVDGINVDTPIILFTGNVEDIETSRDNFINMGFDDCLAKPISTEQLNRILKTYLPKNKVHMASKVVPTRFAPSRSQDSLSAYQGKYIDKKSAMTYCNNSEETYCVILDTYLKQKDRYHNGLKGYLAKNDWKNYAILAHSLKSTSLMVGAKELSELAKQHESAAKTKDYKMIRETIDDMLSLYDNVLEEIEKMLEKG